MRQLCRFSLPVLLLTVCGTAHSAVVAFDDSDFTTTPQFSNVQTFGFSIDLTMPLAAGASYVDPALNGVVYNVQGSLAPTPSGFPAFNLQRTIGGSEFYAQGSSLSFAIAAGADLSDGLQLSELTAPATDPVFRFNGREVDTGRYHPALLELYADGTGSIRNSNNFGGINPGSGELVDVVFGEEYITALTFDPATLTLVAPSPVPVPAAFWLFGSALLCLRMIRRD